MPCSQAFGCGDCVGVRRPLALGAIDNDMRRSSGTGLLARWFTGLVITSTFSCLACVGTARSVSRRRLSDRRCRRQHDLSGMAHRRKLKDARHVVPFKSGTWKLPHQFGCTLPARDSHTLAARAASGSPSTPLQGWPVDSGLQLRLRLVGQRGLRSAMLSM